VIPQLVSDKKDRHRRGKKITATSNYRYVSSKVGEGNVLDMFRVQCNLIPDRDTSCKVNDMIAVSLGGVRSSDDLLWYLPSKELAMDHLALWVLCACGDSKYYKKLESDVIKKHSQFPHQSKKESNVAVLGYPMEPHPLEDSASKNPAKNNPGVIGYFLLASKTAPSVSGPELVIPIPSRKHSQMRASGIVTR
jgi:hypothetical protein